MSDDTKKIGFIEDADASGELAKVYDEWRAHSGRQQMPGILKCFSHVTFCSPTWANSP